MERTIRLKGWREVLTEDWPRIGEVTRETIRRAVEYKGQVRKPYSSSEYEAWRARVLATPLP